MKIRKPVFELLLEDLEKYPTWEFASDEEGEEEQDETFVRPVNKNVPIDAKDGMFIVRARFTLADGSVSIGYLTPPTEGDESLGQIQPVIVTNKGQVGFWSGIFVPKEKELQDNYLKLGRQASQIFPLNFESTVEIKGGAVRGVIPGFQAYEDYKTKKIKTVI